MTQSYAILTAVGRNKEAAALAAGTALTITEIALGDGDRLPAGAETALENEVHRGAITAAGVLDPEANTAYFELYLPIEVGGFVIREAGLFDGAGDMIAIARYNDPIPKFDPASGASNDLAVRIHIIFSDVQNLAFSINPVLAVTTNNIAQAIPWATDEEAKDPTVTHKAIDPKRLHAGLPWATEAEAEDETKEFKIIDPKRLWHVLRSFFIGTIKTNTTYKIGSHVSDDFPTLIAAHAELLLKIIMPWVTVKLEMRDEVHTYDTDVVIDHPNARRMLITSMDAPVPPSRAGMALTGPTHPQFYGNRIADNATNAAYLNGLYGVEIEFTGSAGLVLSNGLALLENICFRGASTGTSISILDGVVSLKNIASHTAGGALSLTRAHVVAEDFFASGNASNAVVMRSSYLEVLSNEFVIQGPGGEGINANFNNSVISGIGNAFAVRGCGSNGIASGWNAAFHLPSASIGQNAGHGIAIGGGCSAYLYSASSVHNLYDGLNCQSGSSANVVSGNFSSNNIGGGTAGVTTSVGSHTHVNGCAGTFSPSVNVIGNHNSQNSS